MIDEIAPLFRCTALPGPLPASHAEPWTEQACRRVARFKIWPVLGSKPPAQAPEIAGSHFSISGYGTPFRGLLKSAGGRENRRPTKHTCFSQTFGCRITPIRPDRPAAPNGSHPRCTPFPGERRPPVTVKKPPTDQTPASPKTFANGITPATGRAEWVPSTTGHPAYPFPGESRPPVTVKLSCH
jgi:hypothetical protein